MELWWVYGSNYQAIKMHFQQNIWLSPRLHFPLSKAIWDPHGDDAADPILCYYQ